MTFNKLLIVVLILCLATAAYALRIPRPVTLQIPITEDQVNSLNKYLEDLWNIQYGRFELDIVTTSKSNAKNGEIWFIQTGNTVRLQYKANNHVFTITPYGF